MRVRACVCVCMYVCVCVCVREDIQECGAVASVVACAGSSEVGVVWVGEGMCECGVRVVRVDGEDGCGV